MSQDRKPSREQDSSALEKVTTAVDSKENDDCKAALDEIIGVMRIESGNSKEKADCEDALTEFGDYLRSESVRGRSVEILVKAVEQYFDNYDKWGGWDSAKNTLFWRNVVLQTKTPTCDDRVTNKIGGSI
jgi:hypothetical protein